jgi:hypothetical protein
MPEFPRRPRLPSLFFWLTLTAAAVLIALVFLSPLLDNQRGQPRSWAARVVVLFARDLVLRRTALASGLCLAVTACVFFRRPGGSQPGRRKRPRPPRPTPPPDFAGA